MFPKRFETTVYTEQFTVCPSDLMLNINPLATGSAQASSYLSQYYTLAPAAIDAVECVHYVNNSYCDILYSPSLRSRSLCQWAGQIA